MNKLRTPDERFNNLPGFDFRPHYLEGLPSTDGLRIHYLDEGPQDASDVFLCLHGQPTWCYLYRKMIPIFTSSGGRVVAPDLYGFGRSDKPTDESSYTFSFHRTSLLEFIKELDLKNITLVCQDWGGLLGLTLPVKMPERFSRLIVMNTFLATGHSVQENKAFIEWRAYNNSRPDLDVAKLMKRATPHLSDEEANAYQAPFPSKDYKAGVRVFPNLVPDNPNAPGADISKKALAFWRDEWEGKSFMAIGMQDPIVGPHAMLPLHKVIMGCPPPLEVNDAGHFVQEWGEIVAKEALASFKI